MRCCVDDEVLWPFGVALRGEAPNHLKLRWPFLRRINTYLMRWARKKYKRLRSYKRFRAWWTGLVQRAPGLLEHWAWDREFVWTR
jgi:hypothetical protein